MEKTSNLSFLIEMEEMLKKIPKGHIVTLTQPPRPPKANWIDYQAIRGREHRPAVDMVIIDHIALIGR